MGWAYLMQEKAQRTIEPNTLTVMFATSCLVACDDVATLCLEACVGHATLPFCACFISMYVDSVRGAFVGYLWMS
jgi:hypothetical protein